LNLDRNKLESLQKDESGAQLANSLKAYRKPKLLIIVEHLLTKTLFYAHSKNFW